ncbi:MAG: hypothetical protein ACRD1Q_09525 [Vicinamibacterales bacterium]
MRWLAALALALSVACSESSRPTQPTPGPGVPQVITFTGVFSESETNTPLAGVTVCWPGGPHDGSCVQSGASGSYQLAADPANLKYHLPIGPNTRLCPFAFLEGYEQRGACVPLVNSRVSWSTTLQRTITLDAGRNVRSTVFRGEGNGVVDSGLCEPCKGFNVRVPGRGTLFLSVVADSPESKLRIEVFYEGFENGALQITTQRNVQVLVHAEVVPTSFELATSFTPGS